MINPLINPFVNPLEYKTFDDKTYYNEKWIFGWPFMARDLYHSNRIEQYIERLPPAIKESSIYIVHKGFLHFESPKNINPIRYAFNINFNGENHQDDKSNLNYIFEKLKIEDNSIKI